MNIKYDAIQEIIAIAKRHDISTTEIESAMCEGKITARTKSKSDVAMKLFAYLGGIFVFAGISVYIAMFWEDMNSAARIIITLGSGFVAFILSLAAMSDNKYERAVVPLILMAAILQPTGLFVAIYELFNSGSDPRYAGLFVFGVMFIQQFVVFLSKKCTSLLLISIIFACSFYITAVDILGVDEEFAGIILGLSLLCIAYSIHKTLHYVITPPIYFIGSLFFLIFTFDLLEDWDMDIIFLGISCFVVYISTIVRSRTLLTMGTLSLLSYIGYFSSKHFVDSIGWPIALILLGFIMFGVSAVAVKIGRKI